MKNSPSFSIQRALSVSRTLKECKTIKLSESQRKLKVSTEMKESKFLQYHFFIDPISLENIMCNYKDRVLYNNNNSIKEYPDLDFFEKQDGIQTLVGSLNTNTEKGIKSVDHREEIYGSNKDYLLPIPPFRLYLLEAIEDPMVQLLILCALISIILGCTLSDDTSKDWIDGLSMIIAVIIVVMVESITKYQEKKQLSEINQRQAKEIKYKIIRKGIVEERLYEDILVGDLIFINYGEIIPVDILLTEGNGIKMDEFELTGQTLYARKEIYPKCQEIKDKGGINVPSPLILSGTKCVQGNGKGIVLCVGSHSQKNITRIINETDKENVQSHLADDIEKISKIIAMFGFIAGTIILILLFIQFGIEFQKNMKIYKNYISLRVIIKSYLFNFPHTINDNIIKGIVTNDDVTNPTSMIAKKILDILILSLSIVVIAIPEGLSSAVTLSVAFSLNKMMDNKNYIRKIEACENMGSANYICTGKTGFLTTSEMTITKIIIGNNEIKEINMDDKEAIKNPLEFFNNEDYWKMLKLSMCLNIECQIQTLDKEEIEENFDKCDSFNKTDKSIIDLLHNFGVSISYYYDKYLSNSENYKLSQFNPKDKKMTTYIYNNNFPTNYRLYTKGAAEYFSKFCKSYVNPNTGNIEELNEEIAKNINESILKFNKDKLRTIYIAYKDLTKEEYENCENENENGESLDEKNLVLLSIIIMNDPLHKEVKETIQKCKQSFVEVIMITGDNIMNAASIAKECGILSENFDLDTEIFSNLINKFF